MFCTVSRQLSPLQAVSPSRIIGTRGRSPGWVHVEFRQSTEGWKWGSSEINRDLFTQRSTCKNIAIIPCFSNIRYLLPARKPPADTDNPRLSLPWVMSRIGGYRQVGVPITEIGAVFSAILLIFLQFYSTILSVEVTRL
jgi:hypothetical protein